jgi:hypothetical protein
MFSFCSMMTDSEDDVAHGAFEAAVQNWPHERFTLRNGTMVIRKHP